MDEAEERRRVFKFYKGIDDEGNVLEGIDQSLNPFVKSAIISNYDGECLKKSFTIQYNMDEEFFVLRSAMSDSAVASFYREALFQWPLCGLARNNLPSVAIVDDKWLQSFCQVLHNEVSLLDRLRWVTLGYHYDWDNKIYPEGCETPFPHECAGFFKCVSSQIANFIQAAGNENLITGLDFYKNFKPEAAIVNYYRKQTKMGFHVDDAEFCKRAPLISLSLGKPGIFLLELSKFTPGKLAHGNAEEVRKTIIPIILRHGDVMVTGGHSRLAFHAVPKLLSWKRYEKELPIGFFEGLLKAFNEKFQVDCNREILKRYLLTTRLNMNVRQVNASD